MLRAFGLTEHDFVARVSDRRFLRAVFLGAGVPDERLTLAYNIVDKMEREGPSAIRQRLVDVIGIDATNADRILNALSRTTFEQVADLVLENEWLDPDFRDLKNLFERLRAMGLEAYVQIDLSVVRGLAYYTGTVFELFDRRGELRAICGGGRYNDLLKQISGVNLPALGFGMGDVVLTELLKDRDLLPKMEQSVDYYLLAEDYEFRHLLLRTVHTLRDTGYSVEYSLAPALRNRQFKEASALGARKVVVITAEDVARGSVAVPELSS
jgi:histidyl-tRNA synthetase